MGLKSVGLRGSGGPLATYDWQQQNAQQPLGSDECTGRQAGVMHQPKSFPIPS